MALKLDRTNRFGGLLDRFCIAKGLSLHQAGKLLGQHHTVLSAVIRGVETLSRRNLAKIVDRLERGARALEMTKVEASDFAVDLQIAWLEDMALPALEERIAVVRRRQKAAPKVTDPRTQALATLDAASAANPELADWLVASAGVLAHFPAHGRKFRRKGSTEAPAGKTRS